MCFKAVCRIHSTPESWLLVMKNDYTLRRGSAPWVLLRDAGFVLLTIVHSSFGRLPRHCVPRNDGCLFGARAARPLIIKIELTD